ncbi:hypothetical protein BVRB_9g216440 [Beta vulgaris subsp. vulgaris]|nr:hypothetical protein BVRB_9g216440 [Beta vulgaris subsp. vulgaris]
MLDPKGPPISLLTIREWMMFLGLMVIRQALFLLDLSKASQKNEQECRSAYWRSHKAGGLIPTSKPNASYFGA